MTEIADTNAELVEVVAAAIVDASKCKCGKPQPLAYCQAEAAIKMIDKWGSKKHNERQWTTEESRKQDTYSA